MARGVRKSEKERLEADLEIYERRAKRLKLELRDLNVKISEVKKKIESEEFKEISKLMDSSKISFDQLKGLISTAASKK